MITASEVTLPGSRTRKRLEEWSQNEIQLEVGAWRADILVVILGNGFSFTLEVLVCMQTIFVIFCDNVTALKYVKKAGDKIVSERQTPPPGVLPISEDYGQSKKFAAWEKVTVRGGRLEAAFYLLRPRKREGGTKVRYKSLGSGSITRHQLLLVNARQHTTYCRPRWKEGNPDKAVIRLEPGALNLGNWVGRGISKSDLFCYSMMVAL